MRIQEIGLLVIGGKFNLIQHEMYSSKAEVTIQMPKETWNVITQVK